MQTYGEADVWLNTILI